MERDHREMLRKASNHVRDSSPRVRRPVLVAGATMAAAVARERSARGRGVARLDRSVRVRVRTSGCEAVLGTAVPRLRRAPRSPLAARARLARGWTGDGAGGAQVGTPAALSVSR